VNDTSHTVPAARFLEQVLLWNILIHAAGIATMALMLMPGMPGGPVTDNAQRIAYIAEHPWLWRLGWVPWHLAAFIDLLTGIALVCTRRVPRLPAVLTLLVTLCAVIPEQTGELTWVTRGVELTGEAHRTGDLRAYLELEAWSFHLAAVVGASVYIVMALGWTWCFAAAGTWSRALTWLSPFAWGCLSVGSIGLILPEGVRPGPLIVALSNDVGFVLLETWLILVAEQVFRRTRPTEAHGWLAPWRHHSSGLFGRALDAVANSRVVRALAEWAPVPAFRSDITDVIYVNYLVEAERLEAYVPAGLELQRVGPGGRYALFTFLTYRHGHFGPALLGPLRRLMPSPVHSNWRTYVRDPRSGKEGIYFVTNAIASTMHALGARLFSEGMPMHTLARGELRANADGTFDVHLDPDGGSGVHVEGTFRPGEPVLPPPFSECWRSYRDFLAYVVPQDRAFSSQPWYGQMTRQEIALGIPLESCEPLTGQVVSRSVVGYVAKARPVCFRVARVAFLFNCEERDPLTIT
jgi:hypothetical protein